ncbi:MAG TPA: hypothetical protein VOA88_10935 [Candidatus Dormibacteraeota bacterium]|nr:hypothetical protein [Candidatus Dormibacteraeota bacterium]
MPRRTSQQVTRDGAENLSDLMMDANVKPQVVAVLVGCPLQTITRWLVKNERPSAAVQRSATSILKRLIEIRKTGANMTNTQSLRKLLSAESEPDTVSFRSAYFEEYKKNRQMGDVRVIFTDGKQRLFSDVDRGSFFRWASKNFQAAYCPSNIYFDA